MLASAMFGDTSVHSEYVFKSDVSWMHYNVLTALGG